VIFATVGTTLPFDELVREVDRLRAEEMLEEHVVCQIGNGAYEPRHCEWFRFKPSIDQLARNASVVVCHGGTGTVLQMITLGLRFAALANPSAVDAHQAQFLARLQREHPIFWSTDTRDLLNLIQRARGSQAVAPTIPSLLPDLEQFLVDQGR